MTDEEIKELARQCVESMSEEDQLHLLASSGFSIELDIDLPPVDEQFSEKLRNAILEELEPKAHNYIECSNWHLLNREYMILADVADMLNDSEENNRLEDKLEAFGVPWLKYPNHYWSIEDNKTYGMFFIKVPKWKKEEAERAFDAYYKWLCWKDPDFKQWSREIMYTFMAGIPED